MAKATGMLNDLDFQPEIETTRSHTCSDTSPDCRRNYRSKGSFSSSARREFQSSHLPQIQLRHRSALLPPPKSVSIPANLAGIREGYSPGNETGLVYEAVLLRNAVPRSRVLESETREGLRQLVSGSLDVVFENVGRISYEQDPKSLLITPNPSRFAPARSVRSSLFMSRRFATERSKSH